MKDYTVWFDCFDEDRDEIENLYHGIYLKDLYYVAIKTWFEMHTPRFYSARLTYKDLISMILEEIIDENDERFETLYDKAMDIFVLLDLMFDMIVDKHKAYVMQKVVWLGRSCVVHLDHVVH